MARRAAGPAGPLHSAQDPPPQGPSPEDGADAPDPGSPDEAADLERLRASLLHGRAGHAAPLLRVEDPVHLPPGAEAGWLSADADGLGAGESALMHPDDLAALHALPPIRSETGSWDDAPWSRDVRQTGQGTRLVGAAEGISLWDDGPHDGDPWADGRWDDAAPPHDEPATWEQHGRRAVAAAPGPGVGLPDRRWVQLVACALVALLVGVAATLLVTTHQVDAARADAERQRQAASSARADLVRERAAATGRAAPGAATPAPVTAPPVDPGASGPSAAPTPPPSAPTAADRRPPVAEAPAPTTDPGPPPPGPSPSASQGASRRTTAPPAGGAASSPGPSPDRSSAQDDTQGTGVAPGGEQDAAPPVSGDATQPADGQGPCTQAPPEDAPGSGGDGPACP